MIFHVTLEQAEDGWIVAECPALPGCVSQGRDEKEALENIREAIQAWLWAEDQRYPSAWHPSPPPVKRSPAPLLHAASKAVRRIFYEGFALFVAAYRTAAEKLKRGDPHPGFPLGSFPPAMPFVGG